MNLPTIDKIDVKGKRVILRVDFNVLLKNGDIGDIYRIKRTLPTIDWLKNNGAKTIIISHLSSGKKGSLALVAEHLNKTLGLNIIFLDSVDFKSVGDRIEKMAEGEIILLENVRIHKGEEENDDNFSKKLSELGDIYANDAFSVAHRAHASIVGITKYLPSYAGLLFNEEVRSLESVFAPQHPFLLILGGVKFESKIGVIDRFLNIADKIFIGGALANNFFKARGDNIGESVFDSRISVGKYLDNEKIILPFNVTKKSDKNIDIVPKTVENLVELIKKEKFILWNGPPGNIEEGFGESTKIVAEAIANSGAKSIVGGGDTVAIINKMGLIDKFSFVSTGGGAMLQFLAYGTLPGIEALKNK